MTTPPAPPQQPPASAPASGAASAPATAPAAPASPEAPLAERVGAIEQTLHKIEGMLTRRPAAPTGPDQGQIEEITRRELERGQAAQAAADQAKTAGEQLAEVRATVAKLTEAKPRPPRSGLNKLMWPGHARD